MTSQPIRRQVRPLNRRKAHQYGRIRAGDLPVIAAALGISVEAVKDTAKRLETP